MIVVGVRNYFTARTALEQDVFNRLATITLLKESEFKRWNTNNQELLRILAQRPLVREYAADLVLMDEQDTLEFESLRRNLLQDHLQATLDVESGYIDFALIRANDGQILVSTDETLEGKYRESEEFFIRGKLDTYVQYPAYHLGEEKAIMHISTPVTDKDGRVVAVLSGHVELNEMSRIQTRRSEFSATEETYIVNHSNLLITESRFEAGSALRKSIFTQGVASCLAGNNGFGFYDDYRGVPVAGHYRWMAEENLCILTEEDQAEAFLAVDQLYSTMLLTIFVAVVVSVGVGLLTTRSITRPLQELEQRAASLATSLYEPLPTKEMGRFEEIYSLNQSFEQMASEIHERDRYLEEQVAARTVEVQEKAEELELANEILQQHTWNLTLVNEVNSAFLHGGNLEDVIDIVSEKTREMYQSTGISGATVFLLNKDGSQLVMQNNQLTEDVLPKFEKLTGRPVPRLRVPLENGNLHYQVMKSREPHLLDAPEEIKQWLSGYINETWFKESWLREQTRKLIPQIRKLIGLNSVAAIPLYSGDEAIGLMEIFNDEIFTPEEMNRLKLVSNQLAVAIERTRIDEENRELKEFNESIVQTIPGSIVVNDLDGNFTFANPAAIDLLGYQPEELVGEHWGMIFPPDQHELVSDADNRRSQGDADSYEVELLHKNGERIPALIKGSPRYTADSDKFMGTLAVITDISDRKKAEDALVKSETRFRAIVEDQNDLIVRWKPDGVRTFVNEAYCRFYGQERSELLGTNFLPLIAEEERDTFLEKYTQVTPENPFISYEEAAAFPDGKDAWLEWTDRAFYDERGDIIEFQSVGRDITDRKLAEEVILQEKNFSDEIINSLPGIFYLFNAEGKFLRWNKNFETLTGHTADEMLHIHPNEVITEQDQAKSEEAIITGFSEGHVVLEANLKTMHGPTPYYFVGRRTFIDGEPHLMGNAIDITERVQAEEKLNQRSLELERSNQDLERFAYISSHDLQEPLRKVQAFGDRLRSKYDDKLDERGLDYLLRMQEAARRGQEMVDDLLVYSRVSTRVGVIEAVNLSVVVEGVLIELKNAIELAGAQISVGSLPTISADPTQMYQLLHHLIDNAIKFRLPDTRPVVRITAEVDSSDMIGLLVHDNGIGFEEQYVEKIFQPFQRLHGRQDYAGSGIGLAICQRIVERHDGMISVNSEPGKGSTFTIKLPVHSDKESKE